MVCQGSPDTLTLLGALLGGGARPRFRRGGAGGKGNKGPAQEEKVKEGRPLLLFAIYGRQYKIGGVGVPLCLG
jgi:hypothetical protein